MLVGNPALSAEKKPSATLTLEAKSLAVGGGWTSLVEVEADGAAALSIVDGTGRVRHRVHLPAP
jgi:hypothetical protein